MLEQLFGSRTRTKLLRLFLMHPETSFFIRELTRLIDTQINSVRRELQNLLESGIIKEIVSAPEAGSEVAEQKTSARKIVKKKTNSEKQPKKFFQVDRDFLLYHELRALFNKSPRLLQQVLERELSELGTVNYAVLTGFFVDRDDSPIDLLIVGTVLRSRLAKLIHGFEKEIEHEINYTTMTTDEFLYRRSVIDRFLFTILEGKKVVLVDTLPSQKN
ncbi:MAG: hypothetical protein Q8P56_03285 [Candidatus Uhrbacteria bacterium]|nr:hypothetical protein [Candidatus Uhrbacteria bacterium]